MFPDTLSYKFIMLTKSVVLLMSLLVCQQSPAQTNCLSSSIYRSYGSEGATSTYTNHQSSNQRGYSSYQQGRPNQDKQHVVYQGYKPIVYKPFDNTPPSEVGQDTDPGFIPQDRRNLGGAVDPGNQSQGSPVGEPWVMLLFAAATTTIIKIRQVKKA